ncbi:uncharacterized protein MYCFIDRAFT_210212 [Pseudocercospora fijiensis CIRAD86]|uniref:Enoyl reductase (ER) domain-containing protein n=1 Tax=Pseudocercospora fijiensis (strain CIRAD86) TaxID=383855 RepID=M3B7S6_PSEFD|nr:uncharacterized protein MYCFIDRAFT_210212 [Pseudocercospora fijiensis CIRAD86]EME85367.1 hypothetical protein MYCFIDRAFT_210212 [Pseudocercospora fijiensis CIRAD86]
MPKALTIEHVEGKPGKVYYPLKVIEQPEPTPKENDVVVKVISAALNHRDLFIRQALYGGIVCGVPLLADACGTVIKTGDSAEAKKWQGKRVIVNPGQGWKDDPRGPESPTGYAILGGTRFNPRGAAQEMLCIDAGELEEAPKHLTANEAAALPLAGITAWRATMIKSGNAMPGRNVLVTGIGGGVAVMSLLLAVASGANVYVSSGSQEKIDKAISLGAKGGVNYKEKDWDKKLKEMLPKDSNKLDAIIDGAGGDIALKGAKLLREGGIIAQYGMTVGPKMDWIMPDVLKNIELRGSTMGSRKEFADLVAFVNAKGLKPLVSRAVQGIDNLKDIETLFDDMNKGSQLGKLVIEISPEDAKSKL